MFFSTVATKRPLKMGVARLKRFSRRNDSDSRIEIVIWAEGGRQGKRQKFVVRPEDSPAEVERVLDGVKAWINAA